MKAHRLWMIFVLLAFLSACCASTGKPGRKGAAADQVPREGPGEKKTLFPRVMREMPPSGVLDLGPVVVTARAGGMDTMSILQDVAEHIGADAFILEERRVGEAYPVQTKVVSGFLETFDGHIFQVTTYVVRPTGEVGGVKETGFYRAVRFVEGEPGPCKLDEDRLADEVMALFEGVSTLREQIRRLTVVFSKGVIDAETFRHTRKSCLDQKREQPGGR